MNHSVVYYACSYKCAADHGAVAGGQFYGGWPVLTPRSIQAGKGRGMRADRWATLCGSKPDEMAMKELQAIVGLRPAGGA